MTILRGVLSKLRPAVPAALGSSGAVRSLPETTAKTTSVMARSALRSALFHSAPGRAAGPLSSSPARRTSCCFPGQVEGELLWRNGFFGACFFGATVSGLGLLFYQNKTFLKVQAQEEARKGGYNMLRRSQSQQIRELSRTFSKRLQPTSLDKVRDANGNEIWVA